MNKYLIEILQIQNSVILPGLGALMVPSQKSGKIVFNPHLKFNDGSLAKFIANKEHIDAQEAQNKVAKFIREIEAELATGNSYDMFEFGKFYKNAEGEIDFEMYSAAGQDIRDAQKSSANESEPKTTKKIKPVADIISDTPKSAGDTTKKEEPKKNVEETTSAEAKKEIKEVSKKETPPQDSTVKTEQKTEKEIPVSGAKENIQAAKNALEAEAEKLKTQKEEKASTPPPVSDKPTTPETETSTPESKQSKNKFVPPSDSPKKEIKKGAAVTSSAGIADEAEEISSPSTAGTQLEKDSKTSKKVEEKEKKRSKLPLIIILLIIIGLAVAGYFYRHEIQSFFGDQSIENNEGTSDENENNSADDHNENADPYKDLAVSDTTTTEDDNASTIDETGTVDNNENTDDEIDQTEEPVNNTPPSTTVSSSSGNYHVIGNSFSEKANADAYLSDMKSKGYPAKIIGRFDGLYLVALKSYDSRAQANSGRKEVSNDAESAWIFKYPK